MTTSRPTGRVRRRLRRAIGATAVLTAAAATLASGSAAGAAVPARAAALRAQTAAAVPTVAAAAATGGRVVDVRPGPDAGARLSAAMRDLRAGDTLRIFPGTYQVGYLRPDLRLARGTATHPIRITAADPRHLPLLVGAFTFDQADWWQISKLRLQGAIPGRDSVTMDSGTGWQLVEDEISGASRTGAYANLTITKIDSGGLIRPVPTRWQVMGSCLHDAGTGPASAYGKLHQIYVNAVGDTRGGLIARNVFVNTPMGAAVKLGNGGLPDAPGPQGVQVANNTLYRNNLSVLMHGRVRANAVRGNLVVGSGYRLHDGRTVGLYLNKLTLGPTPTPTNRAGHNWFATTSIPLFDNGSARGSLINEGDDLSRPTTAFTNAVCGGSWTPTVPAARAYGRSAPTSYYRLP